MSGWMSVINLLVYLFCRGISWLWMGRTSGAGIRYMSATSSCPLAATISRLYNLIVGGADVEESVYDGMGC